MKQIINKKITVIRNKPKNLDLSDEYLFEHEYKKDLPKAYLLFLKNPLIINDSIYDFKNLSLHFRHTFYASHKSSKKIKETLKNLINSNQGLVRLDEGVWITDSKSENFGHWIIDAMCRLMLVVDTNFEKPVLLPSRFNKSWIKEMLDYANIEYIFLEKDKKYIVNELVLTSQAHPSGNYNPEIVNKLRNLYTLPNEQVLKKRRIWTFREHIGRSVGNFKEIEIILKKYNFDILKTEELSLIEKLSLFNQAEIIAGTHGSGLINMLYMQENSKLLEIRDFKDPHKNAMFSLASALNLDYFYQERMTPQNKQGLIDPLKFERLLNQCLT